ncbi:MAG TPA: CPBP family intramembrane metalloprotease [Thermomonas sp.]|nr:CPBP family intramembrane metalloprotease [Thermomonas sp.]HQY49590.1 CPBP family intramembrane metalloprotease [Thermomonas sp.]HRA57333.1 CPBP family intramembrane metalloprotease [Thermomonas sp.]
MVALPVSALGLLALTTFIPSLAEDILTRGFLLRFTPKPLGFWAYVLASALLYTGNHLWRFDWGLTEQLRLFCLGLAYAAAAYRFRSLWAAVGLHWGWNLAGAALSQAWPTTLADAASGRLVSAAVHLALFAVIAGWVHVPQSAGNASKV